MDPLPGDLAAASPDKLAELQALFDAEARRYGVYPLSDETTVRALPHNRPSHLDGVTRVTLYPENVRMPEMSSINMKNTSFALTAHVTVPEDGARGVVIAQGGAMAGWALYVGTDGRPCYVYNMYGHERTTAIGPDPLACGAHRVGVGFVYDGGGLGKGGAIALSVDDVPVAEARLERTVPFLFSMSGETFDVGTDTCSPVGDYPPGFRFSGAIDRVEIELRPALTAADRHAFEDGQYRGATASQ